MNIPQQQLKDSVSELTSSPTSSTKKSPTSSSKKTPPISTKYHLGKKKKKEQSVIKTRYKYSNYRDFLFSTVGAVVGYGNVWRFPAMAAENGGGSFLLAYSICMVLIGLPMTTIEMYIGQLSGLGVGKTLGLMSPLFQGLGWAMVCGILVNCIEYNLIISYCVFYFLMSFRDSQTLPWSKCGEFWNTEEECRPHKCIYLTYNTTSEIDDLCLQYQNSSVSNTISSSDEFFYNFVVYVPMNPDSLPKYDVVSWRLVMSLFFSWLMVFGCLAFGIKISSKVSYVTVMFPLLALFLILIACLSRQGAGNGLKAFLIPNKKFFAFKTWVDAVSLTLWSLSIGTGMLTTLTSYNPFHNNCQRDAIIVVFLDTFISIFAGFTAFAGLGVIANSMNTTIEDVYNGRKLGFIVYPEILSDMPAAPFWAILFFFMAIVLGLDTQIWTMETVINEIAEVFKQCREGTYRILVVFVMCIVSFLIGIGFCVKNTGVIFHIILETVDSGWCVQLFALLEVSVVVYVYGYSRFARDISLIRGSKPNFIWKIIFTVTTPITLFCLLIVILSTYNPMTFRNNNLSESSHKVMWSLNTVLVSIIFVFAAYRIVKCVVNKKPIASLILPLKEWSPRRKSNLELQKKEIEAAQQGIMGEFELSVEDAKKRMINSD